MPMTFEEFRKKLAEQGGVLPSAWSGPEVQTPQQITGEFAEKFANRPPLEEMVPWADPVRRGIATPEMLAEQSQRDEMMANAEIKPMSRNAKSIEIAKQLDDLVNYNPYRSHENETFMKEWGKEFKKIKGVTSKEMNEISTNFNKKFEEQLPQKIDKLKKQLNRIESKENIKATHSAQNETSAPVLSLEEYLRRKANK